MKRLRLSRMAETDLRDIWTCSANRRGCPQANSYLGTLRTAITGLRDDTTPSRPAGDVPPACRKVSVGRHVVFFRVGDDAVEVLRVLHQRRDAGRWV
jgi:toxin ParE1/3/4